MAINKKVQDASFDTLNLVDMVSKEELQKLGGTVVEDYRRDARSRTNWETRRASWTKLFMQHVEEKSYPWEKCSNVPLPMLTTAVIQYAARAYEAIMPPKEKLRVDYTGDEDALRAERVSKHMNYQLNYEMEEYEGDWDISLFQLPINGSIFRKVFYDALMKRNAVEYCPASDIVVPYNCRPNRTPHRMTHKLRLRPNDIKIRQKRGIFQEFDDYEFGPGTVEIDSGAGQDIKQASDNTEGVTPGEMSDDSPRLVLEQHRLWDLDGDGIQEPYVVTVDEESEKVLRITKRTYKDAQGNEYVIDYFEHYYFFPNPEGYYGLGFGHMLEGLNEAQKTILNQIVDAGHLANLSGKCGFINTRTGSAKGSIKFKLGHFQKVDVNAEDIRKGIYAFEFDGPSQVLFSVLGLLQEYADKVTTVSDIITGEYPRSDTPAAAIVAAMEQGLKVFSAIHKRVHRVLKHEFKKLYRLNGIYSDNNQYMSILGADYVKRSLANQIPIDVMADYFGDIDIQPVSDPTIASRTEQLAIAEAVLQQVLGNPATAQDLNKQRAAYTAYYKALRVQNFEQFLPEPPPPPPDLDPVEENRLMLNEKEVIALSQQDHLYHIGVIDELLDSPIFSKEITPRAKRLIETHRLQHVSFQYAKSASA